MKRQLLGIVKSVGTWPLVGPECGWLKSYLEGEDGKLFGFLKICLLEKEDFSETIS